MTTSRFQTTSLEYNNGVIKTVLLTLNNNILSSSSDFTFSACADGSTFETISPNITHTFSTTGQDLRLRIDATVGATLSIRDSTGTDSPFQLTTTH